MIVKLLTEHHLEFLSLTGGCRGSSESTLVKMSNCWKSHAAAQIVSLQEHDKCLLSICFALFVVNNAQKSFRRAKSMACLVLYSRRVFLITLPLLFKKWVG